MFQIHEHGEGLLEPFKNSSKILWKDLFSGLHFRNHHATEILELKKKKHKTCNATKFGLLSVSKSNPQSKFHKFLQGVMLITKLDVQLWLIINSKAGTNWKRAHTQKHNSLTAQGLSWSGLARTPTKCFEHNRLFN